MILWRLKTIARLCGWGCALSLTCCDPLSGFVECDNGPHREVAPGETAEGVDVDAHVAVAFNESHGELVWSETGDRSHVVVKTERGTEPAVLTNDCDGRFDGFAVRARASLVSDDGFVDSASPFLISLTPDGEISRLENVIVGGTLDFDALKAAGRTPSAWISGFVPKLLVTLVAPELKPQNAEVLVEESLVGGKSQLVSIATLTFQ